MIQDFRRHYFGKNKRLTKKRCEGFSAMTKTFFADAGALMSPRTAKYVEALFREGDAFDCNKWLQRVREEEAEAKQILAASASGEPAPIQIKCPISTSNFPNASSPGAVIKSALVPRAIWRLHHKAISNGPTWALKKISAAWGEFQASRARDAVYAYLEAVFAIVMHYKVRRRTKRLLRQAFSFSDLPIDKKADPFTAVIRCTSGGAADNKMISKWARALRYSARCKEPGTRLKAFMKAAGGVNACATRYAKLKQRPNRPPRRAKSNTMAPN
jgi:hypothetical protein